MNMFADRQFSLSPRPSYESGSARRLREASSRTPSPFRPSTDAHVHADTVLTAAEIERPAQESRLKSGQQQVLFILESYNNFGNHLNEDTKMRDYPFLIKSSSRDPERPTGLFQVSKHPKATTRTELFPIPYKFEIDGYQGEVLEMHNAVTGVLYGIHMTHRGQELSPSLDLPFRVFKRFGSTSSYAECSPNPSSNGLLWLWNSATEALHFVKKDMTGGSQRKPTIANHGDKIGLSRLQRRMFVKDGLTPMRPSAPHDSERTRQLDFFFVLFTLFFWLCKEAARGGKEAGGGRGCDDGYGEVDVGGMWTTPAMREYGARVEEAAARRRGNARTEGGDANEREHMVSTGRDMR
ncbi:hypothetical protein SISSUDRAFT_1097489 [Sistotremastrum suecicum HHB10207 ss-3]|uniref:Uncharacterized protein n=1 Tax=Sistotremastrum suecicum HHB10207 ss-3 TaxID=1314776 RepID=A0A165X9S1_9AGAM|nr:hypothetical protein SISSUDRAFT_1097489 [Sistotremastrum suecicum HHB10207 ss-3]